MEDIRGKIDGILSDFYSDNANIRRSPSGKMLAVGSTTAKEYAFDLLPPEVVKAHRSGRIHMHDLDYYYMTLTCLHVPAGRLLQDGFNTGNGFLRPPQRIESASSQVAIMLQSEQNDQFGGVGIANFDFDFAPMVSKEKEKLTKELAIDLHDMGISDFDYSRLRAKVQQKVDNRLFQSMEGLVHNLNTMHSRAGAQVPFTSINLGCDTSEEGRAVTRAFLKAFQKGLGKGETPIFPQVIFKLKKGINMEPESPNYDLFELAVEVMSERMNPTFFFCDASMNKDYDHTELATMGCRTRVVSNVNGKNGSVGRGNLSFTSINLVQPALALVYPPGGVARLDAKEWYKQEIKKVVRLVIRQLWDRYQYQCTLKRKDLPFMMGQELYMGSQGLGMEDSIEPAIKNGTLSVGFIGLAEALTVLFGKNHAESEEAQEFGLEIVAMMRKMTDEATEQYHMNFTLLATPAEGLSNRFTEIDERRFGVIPGVTDKGFYTNSFHVPVNYEISAFEKLRIEAPYHKYCNAGAISYLEFPESPRHNTKALKNIISYASGVDIAYLGCNFPDDFCPKCGYHGLIENACPACGNGTGIMRVRRITGYLGFLEDFSTGKKKEESLRIPHS